MYVYIYIYVYMYRERDMYIYIYIYVYTYMGCPHARAGRACPSTCDWRPGMTCDCHMPGEHMSSSSWPSWAPWTLVPPSWAVSRLLRASLEESEYLPITRQENRRSPLSLARRYIKKHLTGPWPINAVRHLRLSWKVNNSACAVDNIKTRIRQSAASLTDLHLHLRSYEMLNSTY